MFKRRLADFVMELPPDNPEVHPHHRAKIVKLAFRVERQSTLAPSFEQFGEVRSLFSASSLQNNRMSRL